MHEVITNTIAGATVQPEVPSELYHENSKLVPSDVSRFVWIDMVNTVPEIQKVVARPFIRYRGFPTTQLPAPMEARAAGSLQSIAERRRTPREFVPRALSARTFSQLLYIGDGIVKSWTTPEGVAWTRRSAPSPGALYPIEIYPVVFNVEGLAAGLYHYQPLEHVVSCLKGGNHQERLAQASNLGGPISNANAAFILVAYFQRCRFKYGERAYRFCLLETGHIAQNLLLAATAEDLAGIPVGGFVDDELNELVGVDGVDTAVLYMVLVGGR